MENLVNSLPYGGRKVLVTGHTGFKGAWLCAALRLLGADVKGYSLPPDQPNGLFELLEPLQPVASVLADIRDRDRLRREVLDFAPDFIFHLAAQPLVRRSYAIPSETFEVNVVGTANLLEAANALPGSCTIVVITTDKVYENKESDILYTESDALGGYDPYSASKACTELVVQSFRSSFFNVHQYAQHGKAVASARAGNVIGGGDWNEDRIIPDIVRSLQKGEAIPVRNPHAVRPWQHVLEPIAGYLQLGARLHAQPRDYSQAYNFGPAPDDHLSVKELVETAIRSWGEGSWIDQSDPGQPHEAGLLKLSIQKALAELDWRPRLNAATAIDWTIRWYREPLATQADFALRQIKDYFAL